MLRFQSVMKTLPNDGPSRQAMEKVMERADQVLLEGRQSVRDLREQGNSGNELSEAFANCGEEFAQSSASIFSTAVVGTSRAMGPIVFNETYRIGREGMINAFQHAKAGKIELELTYSDMAICVRVRDNGAGMNPQILSEGKEGQWGLAGMRERAQKIGGQLSIWKQNWRWHRDRTDHSRKRGVSKCPDRGALATHPSIVAETD
jgi:signal transduction histidine kinase